MNINYQSDFKIIERRVDGKALTDVPFTFSYYVKKDKCYTASFDGSTFFGCKPIDGGGIAVAFDHTNLGIGELSVRRTYHITDSVFGDNRFDIVSVEQTGICLGKGATDTAVVEQYFEVPFDIVDTNNKPNASVRDGVLYLYGSSASVESITNNILTL